MAQFAITHCKKDHYMEINRNQYAYCKNTYLFVNNWSNIASKFHTHKNKKRFQSLIFLHIVVTLLSLEF